MKSVKGYVMDDLWGHNLMSGDAIRGCVLGTTCKTPEEKKDYCQGIFTMFPHMLLANFSRWMWEGDMPKDYGAFMDPSAKALQAKVFPELDRYFSGTLTEDEKAAVMVELLTNVIPKHVLTGFYDYMFAGQEGYKDIAEFWPEVEPLLGMTKHLILAAYNGMTQEEKAEAFLYLGGRYPFLLIKRWYDWQFGKDKMEMPPPPPQD